MNQLLVKTYVAGAAVGHRMLVKFGASDGEVIPAAAATDAVIGVTDCPGGAALGKRVDVVRLGLTEAVFGGTVARGAYVTADANGAAVAAAPAAGTNNGVVGRAEVSAVAGDIALVLIMPGQIQG